MLWLAKLLSLAPTVIDTVKTIVTKKQEINKIELEGEVELRRARMAAEIERVSKGEMADAELDMISIATRGWKDDYLLIITTTPLVLSFIPSMVPYVDAGFLSLNNVPEYYWYGLALVYIDTLGFRRLFRMAVEKWLMRKKP